jgi:Nuclease-related domain
MLLVRRARAGRYAQQRYERAYKAYRRRMRAPLLICVVPMYGFFLYVVGTHKLDVWTTAAVTVGGGATWLIMFVRDEAPQHILNWRRGAEGERKTEKALRKLERAGWTVEHDLQQEGRANVDHIVRGPGGVYLIETKNLFGNVTVTDGVLQAQPFDDPEEIFRYWRLADRVRRQAAEASTRIGVENGRRTWVNAVVVIWGAFDQGMVEGDRITYVAGERLADWLASRVAARA